MNYVYIIQNNFSGEIYVGFTKNLKRRLVEHNSKGKKFTTRKKGEWIIIYIEIYRSERNAREREYRIKHNGSTKKELFKRINKCLFDIKSEDGRSESFPGNCLPKTQLPANSQEDV
jgi:putative endonuclease